MQNKLISFTFQGDEKNKLAVKINHLCAFTTRYVSVTDVDQ